MKDFMTTIIQRMRTFFLPNKVQTPETKATKNNGNTRQLQRFLCEQFEFRYNQLTGGYGIPLQKRGHRFPPYR